MPDQTITGSTNQPKNTGLTNDPGVSILVQRLSKRFNREWIFKNLDFHFKSGNTYAIVGPNGSGKSTLLQILWGQMPQTSGAIHYKSEAGEIEMENIHRHVSIATPYMDLIDEFTLLEHLRFHFKLKKIRSDFSIDDLLQVMYLKEARDKFVGNFSSGMKQRLKLSLALYTQADIVFLDEPGTNLDHEAFEWYKTELQKLSPRSLIFIASNNPAEYPDHAIRLNILDHKG